MKGEDQEIEDEEASARKEEHERGGRDGGWRRLRGSREESILQHDAPKYEQKI
jgi:hypothetical protein